MFHFYGQISRGRDKSGYYKPTDTGDPNFEHAWFLHLKRNPHHWQYWVIPANGEGEKILEMPVKYRKEMLSDWVGAGKAQRSNGVIFWYRKNKHKMSLGPETRAWIEDKLGYPKVVKPKDILEKYKNHTKSC
jgi:hypothetical protein